MDLPNSRVTGSSFSSTLAGDEFTDIIVRGRTLAQSQAPSSRVAVGRKAGRQEEGTWASVGLIDGVVIPQSGAGYSSGPGAARA
jgi:hypothetical protein